MDMISSIFNTVGTAATQFSTVIGNGLDGIINLFWNAESGVLTALGQLSLIGVGVGLVYWAFKLVRGLMRIR